jgi:hypothetical protein
MMLMNTSREAGEVNPLLISNIVTGFVVVVLTGLSIWLFSQYTDYKNNSDTKVSQAVDAAKSAQQKTDEAAFIEREKTPYRTYAGPTDLGSVTFEYPKTWSAYNLRSTGELEAYLYPDIVPPVSTAQQFAVRIDVMDKAYDVVIKSYDALVKKGSLRSNPYTTNGFTGIRLDGTFSKDREGSVVIFKVRDKTLVLSSDSSTFKNDFNDIVLKNLKFNP